ncbi:hypothetical protein SAY87_005681 [Trapa incisa]|uniref:Uncharacterized protein n=1 Tax=Trapa incisa TaxID=236973 RepID=A0AAN7Q7J4_9MYRT|nr:hypothetical protein SAY87_005681 [Trapa incisa]
MFFLCIEHPITAYQAKGNYIILRDEENPKLGLYDKPLPCFGCGIGWFSLLLGFVFPIMWYFATILYLCNYYQRDPRERAGLAASAIAVSREREHNYPISFIRERQIFLFSPCN